MIFSINTTGIRNHSLYLKKEESKSTEITLPNKSNQSQLNIHKINISNIRKNEEKTIQNKIKHFNNSSLSVYQKRLLILREDKSTKKDARIQEYNIPIENIKKYYEKLLKNKMTKNNINKNLTPNEQIANILKVDKTTTLCIKKGTMSALNNFISNYTNNISNSNTSEQTTNYDSKTLSSQSNTYNLHNSGSPKSFNPVKAQYYKKNNLSDCPLYEQEIDILIPPKYIIDENLFAFLYSDDFKTFYATQSSFISEGKNINNLNYESDESNGSFYDDTIGLYFCGKEIDDKICAKNSFMCKDCMKLNKKKYNLSNKYLINIKGRVAKKYKGNYHCFGHFITKVNKNQIEDCIHNFTCQACQKLNSLSKYYN